MFHPFGKSFDFLPVTADTTTELLPHTLAINSGYSHIQSHVIKAKHEAYTDRLNQDRLGNIGPVRVWCHSSGAQCDCCFAS